MGNENATETKAPAETKTQPAAPKNKPVEAAREGERTLDDTTPLDGVAAAPQACAPDVCELDDRGSKWAGMTNYECPRCAFATVSEDTARSRNPKLA